jgi:hypothetical protein
LGQNIALQTERSCASDSMNGGQPPTSLGMKFTTYHMGCAIKSRKTREISAKIRIKPHFNGLAHLALKFVL